MTEIEQKIYSILDTVTIQINPFVKSCDLMAKLLFEEQIPIESIKLSRDIYSVIGGNLSKKPDTISRNVERLIKRMWAVSPDEINSIAGKPLKRSPTAKQVLFFFAHYIHKGKPFFQD